jgi:hypothetical protein
VPVVVLADPWPRRPRAVTRSASKLKWVSSGARDVFTQTASLPASSQAPEKWDKAGFVSSTNEAEVSCIFALAALAARRGIT